MKNEGRIRESSVTLGREKGGRGGDGDESERGAACEDDDHGFRPRRRKNRGRLKLALRGGGRRLNYREASSIRSRGAHERVNGRKARDGEGGPSIDKLFLLMTYLLAGRYREAAAYRYNLPIFEGPPPTPSLCSLCATLWTHAAFYFSFLPFVLLHPLRVAVRGKSPFDRCL